MAAGGCPSRPVKKEKSEKGEEKKGNSEAKKDRLLK